MKKAGILIICLIIAFLPAIIGSLFTTANSEWYQSIKPTITPPSFVFPIVWTVLYILIGISLFLVWTNKKSNKSNKKQVILSYSTNLILNAIWSPIFFTLHLSILSFIIIIALIASTIWMMLNNIKFSKPAFYLLIPYLLWLLFASILNGIIAF